MRRALPFVVAALCSSTLLPAQGALFLRNGNLTQALPVDHDLRAALLRLFQGPTAAERAEGLRTLVPPGTGLFDLRVQGDVVTVVTDEVFLLALIGGCVEHAIEQIDKTVLYTSGARAVHLRVQRRNGPEVALAELLPGLDPSTLPPPPVSGPLDGAVVTGALSGRTIAVSPGHGYYWHSSLGWTTQRGQIDGLTEDIHTNEIAIQYLIPALEDMGARVISCRERGQIEHDRLADNDQGAPGYVETGFWTTSGSSGYQNGSYRYAAVGPNATATATWTLPVPQDGEYPVHAFYRAGTNRTTDARYTVHHSGGSTLVSIDQTRADRTWEFLGRFHFTAAQGARITLSNQTSGIGTVVIADAVRIGGGRGSISRGSGTSNRPRWMECSRYWAQFAGAPASVYDSVSGGQDNDDDVTARPRYAEWRGADAYLSLHTNAGGGAGTDTFIYNGGATAGSATLQSRVHSQLIADIRALYDPGWTDRGLRQANFGEVRLLSTMPGILVELAFHDTPNSVDHRALHDPRFRFVAGRAYARGVLRYFAPSAPFPPDAPVALRVTQDGARGLLVAWDAMPGATHYTVEQSPDGKGFVEAATVNGTSWSTGPLPHHSMLSFRVRAWNSSGRSFPTEVLTAGTDHRGTAELLLVQGFDRLDRQVKFLDNTLDYLRLHGDAIRRGAGFSLGFDAASNEAVRVGRVSLPAYHAVDWACGEESTQHETFDAVEQFLVRAYLLGGGRLLVSGAEIGWDLDAQGSVQDRDFYRNVLGATYAGDDAGTYLLQAGIGGTVSQGLPAGRFDDGTLGTYDVDWPDVLAVTDARSTVCLRYGNGLVAGIQRDDGVARVVNLGFPLETVTSADLRAGILQGALRFLLAPQELAAPVVARLGQRWPLTVAVPAEPGAVYLLACSDGMAPGMPLPGGHLLPLRDSFLVPASIQPGGIFGNFLGVLDGSGGAGAWIDVPALPFLVGLEFWVSGLTMPPSGPVAVQRVLPWVRATITP